MSLTSGGGHFDCSGVRLGLSIDRPFRFASTLSEILFKRFGVGLALGEPAAARAGARFNGGTPLMVCLTVVFLQFSHLQRSEQGTPAWKHSQYFFRQWLFLQ